MSGVSRRGFLQASMGASGALLLGHYMPSLAAQDGASATAEVGAQLNAFIRIERDGLITLGARNPEIGQGVRTSLPMILAEELDVAWDAVRVEQLGYGYEETEEGPRNRFGPQGAGGSTSIPGAWGDLRQAGASARWLLVQAAAERWETDAAQLSTRGGRVFHPDGRSLAYGEVASRASQLSLPEEPVALKDPSQYRIIGRPTRTVDAEDIARGLARYGIDQYADGVPVAMIERCPYLDGTLVSFDAEAALAIPGVRKIVAIAGPKPDEPFSANLAAGVAVIADDTWAAIKARRVLKIEWKQGPWANESRAQLREQAAAKRTQPAEEVARSDGDVKAAESAATQRIEAEYEVPFLAHATLEPQNALIKLWPDRAELVAPLQSPGGASAIIHALTGIPRSAIAIHMTRVGGGFGRRLENDFVGEAVRVAQAAGMSAVKLVWTREDDMRNDFYRPFGIHLLSASLDGDKALSGWRHHTLATSRTWRTERMATAPKHTGTVDKDGVPAAMVANYSSEFSGLDSGMPRGWWRAPVHTFVAFPIQSFIDEVAAAAGVDPLAFRRGLLGEARKIPYEGHGGPEFDTGRLRVVLDRAAEAIGWTQKPPEDSGRGYGRGIACHYTFGGYVAHAVEVRVSAEGELSILRCVCAADVGRVINPLGLEAQLMGGTIDGISTALGLEITVEGGRVQQSNFHDYPLLRMAQAPDVEVISIDSEIAPAGAGEMGIPSIAPALTNAIFAATGVRIRRLPIANQLREASPLIPVAHS